MKKLRKSAKGQPCHLRIPGICNHNPETTVLAHINRGGISGMGQKPPDICGVFSCSSCHDEIDGRTNKISADLADMYLIDGHMRTLAYWASNGLVKF